MSVTVEVKNGEVAVGDRVQWLSRRHTYRLGRNDPGVPRTGKVIGVASRETSRYLPPAERKGGPMYQTYIRTKITVRPEKNDKDRDSSWDWNGIVALTALKKVEKL
jgi:hypothetical protein